MIVRYAGDGQLPACGVATIVYDGSDTKGAAEGNCDSGLGSTSSYAHFTNPVLQRLLELAQYRAIRYTERLAEADVVASVGSRGDSYGNAMAEAFNSLVNGELIHNPVSRGRGWYSIRDVEIAVAEYVD